MVKKGVLSALTTIGYGLVFLAVVIVSAVLVQIGIYGLGEKNEAIVGLEISSTAINNNTLNVVTNDTSTVLSFTILGNADLEGNAVDESAVQVRLSLRNSLGTALTADNRPVSFLVIDSDGNAILDSENNIQTVDSVDVGINDTVKLVLATYQATNTLVSGAEEAIYIKGGTCYIEAYSIDGRFKAQRVEVNVDVPVETIKVTVTGYNKSGVLSDLTNIINNTIVEYKNLEEESIMPTASVAYLNQVVLYTGITDVYTQNTYYKCVSSTGGTYSWQATDMQYFIKNDELSLSVQAFPSNSLLAVSSMEKVVQFISQNFNESEATLNSSTGDLVVNGTSDDTTRGLIIQAKVLKNYGGTDYVDTYITINTAKLEIDSIIVGNQDVVDGGIIIKVGDTVKLSASSSASTITQSDITNLNISIRSKNYTHGVDPLSENISALYMNIVSNHSTESTLPTGYINVSSMNSNYRDPLVSEQWNAVTGENNTGWNLYAKRQLISNEVIDLYISQNSTFNSNDPYAHIGIVINTTSPSSFSYTGDDSMSIVKYDGGMTGTAVDDVIDLTSGFISYSTTDDEDLTYTKWVYFLESSSTNVNSTGSSIIEVSTAGQIMHTEGSTVQYSQTLSGIGDGTVRIRAYLVRTDSSGNPIDCCYNTITESTSTGYVTKANADINNVDDIGKYVVEYSAMEYYAISVNELLDYTKFFYDEDLTLPVTDTVTPSQMGTTLDNTKYIYLQGNSMLSLLNEYNNLSVDKEVTQVDESLVIVSSELITERDATTNDYNKIILKIEISSAEANVFKIIVNQNDVSIKQMYMQAIDVSVGSVTADWSNLQTELSAVTTVDNVKTMNIYGVLNENIVNWYYETEGSDIPFVLPYGINYTYNIIGASQNNLNLVPLNVITLHYSIYALTDAQLLQAVAGTLDWSDDLLCSTISIVTLYNDNEVTGIKLILQNGWQDETGNLILAYKTTSTDGTTSEDKVDFYEINIADTTPTAVWTGTPVTQLTSNYATTENNIVFDLNFWDVEITDGTASYTMNSADLLNYLTISVSDNVSTYFSVNSSGQLVLNSGYVYSASNTTADNVVNSNSTFDIDYYLYDLVGNVLYEKVVTITLIGYIEISSS